MVKTVLILSSVWVEPNSSAAGTRMLQLMQLFLNDNYKVVYASTATASEFSFDLKSLNIATHHVEINNDSFDDFLLSINPKIVLFDRFMVEEQLGWRVSNVLPNAIKILDTEDLHALRICRKEALKNNVDFLTMLKNADITKREIASIFRCDVSLMVSEFEIELLKNQLNVPQNLLFYLPLFTNEEKRKLPPFEQRKDFVFIGNFYHEPNYDAVLYLKNEIWSILKNKTKANLQIYGAYTNQKVQQLHNPKERFFVNGRAESAFEVIANARVLLAPLRFGAGIKGKLLEAMQYETPNVTTNIGAEGMQFDDSWSGFIANEANDFAEKANLLYENQNVWNQTVSNGNEIIEKKFRKEIYKDLFLAKINFLMNNLETCRNENFIGKMLQYHGLRSTEFMSRWIELKNKN